MNKSPRGLSESSFIVVFAISFVLVFAGLVIHENSVGGAGSFILGGLGYWLVCFAPISIIISVVAALLITGFYSFLRLIILRQRGIKVSSEQFAFAVGAIVYIILTVAVFLGSKSIGQPDGQAILAALFITPFFAIIAYVILEQLFKVVAKIQRLR